MNTNGATAPQGRPDFWEAESLRFSVFFPTTSGVMPSSTWWDDIVGTPPENKLEKPREGVMRQDAVVDGVKVTLNVTPARADLVFTVDQLRNVEQPGIPVIGSYPSRQAQLDTYVQKFSALEIPLTRMAYGAVLIREVGQREEGYQFLKHFLPLVQIDVEGSRDFFYQINRPQRSSVLENAQINRLSKWSVLMVQPMLLQITSGKEGSAVTQYLEQGTHGVRLEVDISTPAEEASELPAKRSREIWNELTSFGLELATQGDFTSA